MDFSYRFIENNVEIETFTLEYLQTETLKHLLSGVKEFQSQISTIDPINVCTLPHKAKKTDYSLYCGFGGYLFLYLRMYRYSLALKDNSVLEYYKTKLEDFFKFQEIFNDERILNGCSNLFSSIEPLITVPIEKEKPEPMITFFMGKPGIYVLSAFLAYYQGNVAKFAQSLANLKKVLDYLMIYQGKLYHEMLYGTAGLLYCFLVLQKSFQSSEIKSFQVDFKQEIYQLAKLIYFRSINKTIGVFKIVIFDQEYLGAAHGLFGVLYTLMKAHELTSDYLKQKDPEFEKVLLDSLTKSMEFGLGLQYESGNFSSSTDINEIDEMLQYCHGSPGIIPVLTFGSNFFKSLNLALSEKIKVSVLKAGHDLWKRGLLKKGFNLCHGISGNAYAFINLYNFTKDEKWLKRAYVFAVCRSLDDRIEPIVNGYDSGNRFAVGKGDHPYSLMEGLAGHLCLLMDLDKRNIENAKFPGLEI